MSTGPRIPHALGTQIASELSRRWDLARVAREVGPFVVVGSLRRQVPTVGDVEFLTPHEPREKDTLYAAIEATMRMPGQDAGSIFGANTNAIGRPVEGFKRGFLAADLLIEHGGLEVPVQVFRYTPANRGWQLLMRTGPAEFGRWFLGEWKKAFDIPLGVEGCVASKDGHLVDRYGITVPVESEEECFTKARIAYVPPVQREAWRKS